MFRKLILTFAILGISVFGLASRANAVALDLSALGSSGTVNGALFDRDFILGEGTGNFKPFLRLKANGTETGYNTDGVLQFDELPGPWTHSVKISEIPLVTVGLIQYRQIILDAGEPGPKGGANNRLLISKLELYLLSGPSIVGYPGNFPVADRKYQLVDASFDSILLNNIVGNGAHDLVAYFPDSIFTGPNEYLYLYNQNTLAGGTFEEWGTDPGTVPEPMSLILFGTGLVGASLRRRF